MTLTNIRFPFSNKPLRLDFSLSPPAFRKRSVSSTLPLTNTASDYNNFLQPSGEPEELAPFVCPKPINETVFTKISASKRYFKKVPEKPQSKEAPPTIELVALDQKLAKIVELEEKLLNMKSDFTHELALWQSYLPDESCKEIIDRLRQSIIHQIKTSRIVNGKLQKIGLEIENIKVREKKQTDLGFARYDIEQRKKSVDLMHGMDSTDAKVLIDELEVNFINFKTVQRQYANVIKRDFKEHVDEYVLATSYAIKTLGTTLEDVANGVHNSIELDADDGDLNRKRNENISGDAYVSQHAVKQKQPHEEKLSKNSFENLRIDDKNIYGLKNNEWEK